MREPTKREPHVIDTLQAMVRSLASEKRPSALISLGQETLDTLSHVELAQLSRRLGAGLAAAGMNPGEHVILFAPNSSSWIIACLALLEVGAVATPIDTQAPADDLRHMLGDSRARWIFTTAELAPRLASSKPKEARIVLLDGPAESGEHWRDLLADRAADLAATAPGDCAALFYTSGTTGAPKGVPLTNKNLVSNIQAMVEQGIADATDRVLVPLPLHHVYPFTVGLLLPLMLGSTVILPYALTGPQMRRALTETGATIVIGVPRLYAALVAAIEQGLSERGPAVANTLGILLRACSALRASMGINFGKCLLAPVRRQVGPEVRLLASGGAALDPQLAGKLLGLGWDVMVGYGLTETSPILSFTSRSERSLNTVGRALPGVQLSISPAGRDGGLGEVVASGPNVFSGYLNLPDKTAEAFDPQGRFRTGDLGYLDDKGRLHLLGRRSSMIVSPGGENINPEDVERAVQRASHVKEAAVLQEADRLVAIVVPELEAQRDMDSALLEDTLRNEVVAESVELPSYKRVGEILIDKSPLPRTRMGKLRRHKLREDYDRLCMKRREGKARRVQVVDEELSREDLLLLEQPVARHVWDWLQERFRLAALTPDSNLRLDLHVDSMEWLRLTLEIRERVGVELTEEAIATIETVRDLLEECATIGTTIEPGLEADTLLREPEALLNEEQKKWLQAPGPLVRTLGRLIGSLARPLMKFCFHLTVRGQGNIPQTGPFILAANHQSGIDPIVIAAVLGTKRLSNTCWGAWSGMMFTTRLKRLFCSAVQVLPVDARKNPFSSVALGVCALRKGHNLVWFPEGQRSTNRELLSFRHGIGLLARACPIRILPVRIEGSGKALPPGTLWPKSRDLGVTFGEALTADDLEAQAEGDSPSERIANALHDHVARLAVPQ